MTDLEAENALLAPLFEAGWSPSRRVDLTEMVLFFEANRLYLGDHARAFLHSFLGLYIVDVARSRFKVRLTAWARTRYPLSNWPGRLARLLATTGDRRVLDFRIDTVKRVALDAPDFEKEIGKRLTGVGRDAYNDDWLFMDEDGVGWSVYDLTSFVNTRESDKGCLPMLFKALERTRC